jgi:diaminopimelate epimerase
MRIEFGKYEGAGNDFVIIDNREKRFEPQPALVAALCDRRFGIGADGLMLLEEERGADFRMRYFNSDGPEATMCGNGGRCIALFAFHVGAAGERMSFVAVDGPHRAEVLSCGGDAGRIALGMTEPHGLAEAEGGWFVDTGSPHYVRFVEDTERVDVRGEGRRIRHLPAFAGTGGVNVNFVEVTGEGRLKVRTYERGVEDETLACGTGAVAASRARFPQVRNFDVQARGGLLNVAFAAGGGFADVRLTGPARRVFAGVLDTENF